MELEAGDAVASVTVVPADDSADDVSDAE